jgi:maltose alpha-D-glucosyltransferase/alpha-amylase
MTADWFRDSVIYEIYPQSFADSDGDGIGDLRGVIDRLDHLAWLGIDAIWYNPCFESPFRDAGYDVSDYLRIAPRYGTNADLEELVARARERGMRVLLDLVVGHTSSDHPWFVQELNAQGPAPEGDRYVWCVEPPQRDTSRDLPGTAAWVPSPGPRAGFYLKNFYDTQPALNFGWASTPDDEPWRDAVDAPGPRRNREALKEILAFWFERGIAGFRVDMAFSLVKEDPGHVETTAIWRELRDWMDEAYPERVLIPEGNEPRVAGEPLAFDADFFLVIFDAHRAHFDNGYAGRLPFGEHTQPYFDAAGKGSVDPFLRHWEHAREAGDDRLVVLASADHDYDRLRCGAREPDQLGCAWAFLLTWGSIPSIYYGDEIGMRYLRDLPDVEGAVCHPDYNRAGCRTPMQWDDGPNAGFSTTPAERLYLPVDPAEDRPTVAAQAADPHSTLHLVHDLLALRRATPALGTRAATEVLATGYPFAYVRGGTHLVVVNPRGSRAGLETPRARGGRILLGEGVTLPGDDADLLSVEAFGWAVVELA